MNAYEQQFAQKRDCGVTMIGVSVVVPTCNRPQLLHRCLEALLAQNFDPSNYEVIVVDDAANEQTRQVVENLASRTTAYRYVPGRVLSFKEEFSAFLEPLGIETMNERASIEPVSGIPNVRYIPVDGPVHGPAAARNIGWRAAQGEIIAFTDDDCIPAPEWLMYGTRPFEEGISGVNGRVVVPISPQPSDYEVDFSGLERSTFATTNCFYKRTVMEEAGGFDERFRIAWREDSDFFFRVLELNCHLAYASDAVVIHPVHPAGWGISVAQQRKNFYNALLFKKHPAMYRRFIQSRPPWRYYAIVASLLVLVLSLLLDQGWLALAAFSVWSILTARFFLSRIRHTSHDWRHVFEMLVTSVLIPPAAVYWRIRGAMKFRVFFL